MKKIFTIVILFVYTVVLGQTASPVTHAKTIEDFVPKGWKQITIAKGDLNKDGKEDVALVIEDTDKKNFISNENMGSKILNVNPRQLLVLFKDKAIDSYNLAVLQDAFIPEANSEEDPCLADPLLQDGGIDIKRGTLIVDFHDWVSCGSYWVGHVTYIFRYQQGSFMLIGYDTSEYNRASGEQNKTSINFVTKKKSVTTGDNVLADTTAKPQTVWADINITNLLRLEDVNRTTEMNY